MAEGCKIYVGNLHFDTSEDDLYTAFGEYGGITDCKVVLDRDTGRSRGFAFITFDNKEPADKAVIDGGFDLKGREIRVSIAQNRNDSRGGGGGGGGRGGGRGSYQSRGDGGYNSGGYQYQSRSDGGYNSGGYQSRGDGGYNSGAYGRDDGSSYNRQGGGW